MSWCNQILFKIVMWWSQSGVRVRHVVRCRKQRLRRRWGLAEKKNYRKDHCGRLRYRWSGSRVGDAETLDLGIHRVCVRVCVVVTRQLACRCTGRRSRGKTVRYWRLRRRRWPACYFCRHYIVTIFSFSFLAGRRPAVGKYLYMYIFYILPAAACHTVVYSLIHRAISPPFFSLTMQLFEIWFFRFFKIYLKTKFSNSYDVLYYLRRWKLLFLNENSIFPL